MICDPRMLSRNYGRVFLRSLPVMPLSQRLQDVQDFFAPAAADEGVTGP